VSLRKEGVSSRAETFNVEVNTGPAKGTKLVVRVREVGFLIGKKLSGIQLTIDVVLGDLTTPASAGCPVLALTPFATISGRVVGERVQSRCIKTRYGECRAVHEPKHVFPEYNSKPLSQVSLK